MNESDEVTKNRNRGIDRNPTIRKHSFGSKTLVDSVTFEDTCKRNSRILRPHGSW